MECIQQLPLCNQTKSFPHAYCTHLKHSSLSSLVWPSPFCAALQEQTPSPPQAPWTPFGLAPSIQKLILPLTSSLKKQNTWCRIEKRRSCLDIRAVFLSHSLLHGPPASHHCRPTPYGAPEEHLTSSIVSNLDNVPLISRRSQWINNLIGVLDSKIRFAYKDYKKTEKSPKVFFCLRSQKGI